MIAFPAHVETTTPAATAPKAATPKAATPEATNPETTAPEAPTAHSPPASPEALEKIGNEIAQLAAHIHAATYRLLVLIRDFDQGGGWGNGFLSCAHWLSWRTGIGPGSAREKVRVAHALADLPGISSAMKAGELSYSKVRALTRVATPENERDLLEVARHRPAAQLERLIRAWRRLDRLEAGEEEAQRHRDRFLHLIPDHDGSYVIRGRLDPEVGAVLEKALEWAAEALWETSGNEGEEAAEAPPATFPQRRADALGLIAERALAAKADGDKSPVGRAERFQVIVHAQGDVSAETWRRTSGEKGTRVSFKAGALAGVLTGMGSGVSAEAARRLSCDSDRVVMTHGSGGQILDVGRKSRTVPPPIRRALNHRDGGCRFPGCECRFTDAHHVTHWAEGGKTALDNLVLLCRRHHRAVHEGQIRVRMEDGGERICFFDKDGKEIPSAPETPLMPPDPVAALTLENGEEGVVPHEWTTTPHWHGESLDLRLALDMLRGSQRA